MSLFARKAKCEVAMDRTVGADGYRNCDRPTICSFQTIIEREQGNYEALRIALKKFRVRPGMTIPDYPVTITNLRAAYNDVCYADAEIAYIAR